MINLLRSLWNKVGYKYKKQKTKNKMAIICVAIKTQLGNVMVRDWWVGRAQCQKRAFFDAIKIPNFTFPPLRR